MARDKAAPASSTMGFAHGPPPPRAEEDQEAVRFVRGSSPAPASRMFPTCVDSEQLRFRGVAGKVVERAGRRPPAFRGRRPYAA